MLHEKFKMLSPGCIRGLFNPAAFLDPEASIDLIPIDLYIPPICHVTLRSRFENSVGALASRLILSS